MINVTQATKNAYLNDSGNKQLTITFPNLSITLTNEDIKQESFELTERVNSGSSIEFVGCLASVLKFTTKTLKADVKGEFIHIEIKCNNTESITLFNGFVDKVEQKPHQPDKTIIAYDVLYKLSDTDIAVWYSNLSFPMTIKQFRDSLFTHLGITQVSVTLVNDDISFVRQYSPSELKALDVVKSICQINCVFGKINREGKFAYIAPPNPTTVLQSIGYYKQATYQEYKVKPVDKLTLRFSDGKEIVYGGGSNNYIIVDNFFAKGLDDSTLHTMAQRLYSLVSSFRYQPFDANVNALPYIECTDVISLPVKDLDTQIESQQPFVVLERTIKGIQAIRDTFKASGDEYQKVFESDLSIQIEELKKQIEIIRSDMDNLKFAYYLITNSDGDINIGDGETKDVFDMYFTAKDQSVVTFNCEILCDVETTEFYDAVGKVTYYMDDLEIGGFYPTETWQDGKHILNLYLYLIIQNANRRRFKATMNMAGGSIHIGTANLRGAIYGQNLVASDEWNGITQIDETVERVDIPKITQFVSADEDASVTTIIPVIISTSDVQIRCDIPKITVFDSANDTVFATTHTDSFPIVTETDVQIVTEDDIIIYTEGD